MERTSDHQGSAPVHKDHNTSKGRTVLDRCFELGACHLPIKQSVLGL